MNRATILVLIGMLLVLGGCGGGLSDGQRLIIAGDTYAATANTVAVLVREGHFGTAEKARLKILNDAAKDLILELRDEYATGNNLDFALVLRKFQGVLDELMRLQLQAEAAKGAKTDGSSRSADPGHGKRHDELAAGVPGNGPGSERVGSRGDDPTGARCTQEPGRRPEGITPLIEIEWD